MNIFINKALLSATVLCSAASLAAEQAPIIPFSERIKLLPDSAAEALQDRYSDYTKGTLTLIELLQAEHIFLQGLFQSKRSKDIAAALDSNYREQIALYEGMLAADSKIEPLLQQLKAEHLAFQAKMLSS